MERMVTLTSDGVNAEGAAVARYGDKTVGVFGMLPGEKGSVVVSRTKYGYIGKLSELLESSPRRVSPQELHFVTCGPWQIAEYPLQLEMKRDILAQLFPDISIPPVVPADRFYGYRTKLEFSFTDRDLAGNDAPLQLAFHERGGGARRVALPEGCALASEAMNRVALAVATTLRAEGVPARSLKSLIVRESKATGELLALLYVKDENFITQHSNILQNVGMLYGAQNPALRGIAVFYSTPKSPASVVTKELHREGKLELEEEVAGKRIAYAYDAFFQNNVPMFETALAQMRAALPEGCVKAVELYSGAGTIGIALADRFTEVVGVETIPAAVENANGNAERNGVRNYRAECLPAEKIDADLLEGADVLILDPPRTGLHAKVVDMIREKRPASVVYLSCNPVTQGRDAGVLADEYDIESLQGFDFYPQTPHMESLLVLRRKS